MGTERGIGWHEGIAVGQTSGISPAGMTPSRPCDVGAAGVGNGWNTHLWLALGGYGQLLQPTHASFTEAFGIGHDVRLCHRHKCKFPLMRNW